MKEVLKAVADMKKQAKAQLAAQAANFVVTNLHVGIRHKARYELYYQPMERGSAKKCFVHLKNTATHFLRNHADKSFRRAVCAECVQGAKAHA